MEANAINRVANLVSAEQCASLVEIYEHLTKISGILFFSGVGKSGLIGQKLASTFRSLGIRSIFLHPVEALHGDLGLVSADDSIVYLSKSGTTEEILNLHKYIDIEKSRVIGLLGNADSPIGELCGLNLNCSVEKEACLNNQAPTTSSTVALAVGDAMAVVYEKFKNLSKEDFAVNHPGGLLGKALRVKVKDLAWKAADCPVVNSKGTLKDVMLEMTQKNLGGCAIVDGDKFLGLMVEGDIRRAFNEKNASLETNVTELMNNNPIQISSDDLASKALELMEFGNKQINILPIVEGGSFFGFIRLHDLVREGFTPKN